ncbi:hypothetical protein [Streptomyces sp. c-19]|uniref:hypothetical protein n=1 Tax=Streptomyces sp. c-19 TaxID=2789275 RepID=UPI003980FB89
MLASGVIHIDPAPAVFEAMLDGWAMQQRTRFLKAQTIQSRVDLVRRFAAFTNEYPWQWQAAEVEAFIDHLRSGQRLGSQVDPDDFLDDHERWRLLRECFTDEDIPLHRRVAGSLVLLYGQRPQHIVTLTRSHVTTRGRDTYLSFGHHPVLLPPPLAEIVQRLTEAEPFGRRPIIREHSSGNELLFPGFRPGAFMDHGRLTKQLNALGIRVRSARNSALCSLAGELPAPVVAELFGVHIATAVRWGRLVKRDWAAYLAARRDEGT